MSKPWTYTPGEFMQITGNAFEVFEAGQEVLEAYQLAVNILEPALKNLERAIGKSQGDE